MGRPRLPRAADFTSPVHDPRVTARLGVALGTAFAVCFLTGLLSHLHQHPVAWLPLGPSPSWGYRLTQGLHVATGTACVPLLLAKLYAAYPALWAVPRVGSPLRALERASLALLVGSALFQVSTGVMNVVQWYPWGFFFTTAHWAVAWVAIGSVVVHVGTKLPVIREALSTPVAAPVAGGDAEGAARSRRGFLLAAAGAVAAVTVLTVGQTVRPLRRLAVLAPRDPAVGPQGLPVNRTAQQAGVVGVADDPAWALELTGPAGTTRLDRAALLAMPQRTVDLPIACVEGWSATGTWTGVPLRDLAALAGASGTASLHVASMQRRGGYRSSTVPAAVLADPDALLALRLGGEDLDLQHGYPARVVAPNRPGVLQTKWVRALAVREGERV